MSRFRSLASTPSRSSSRWRVRPFGVPVGSRWFHLSGASAMHKRSSSLRERFMESGFLSQGQPPKAFLEALRQGLWPENDDTPKVEKPPLPHSGSTDGAPPFRRFGFAEVVGAIPGGPSSWLALRQPRGRGESDHILYLSSFSPCTPRSRSVSSRSGTHRRQHHGSRLRCLDMAGKRVTVEGAGSGLKRVAVPPNPSHPTNTMQLQGAEAAATTLGVHSKRCPCAVRNYRARAQGSTRHRGCAERRYPTLGDAPRSPVRRVGREPAAAIYPLGRTSRPGASCRTVESSRICGGGPPFTWTRS